MNRAAGRYLRMLALAIGLSLYGADSSRGAPAATSASRDADTKLEPKAPAPGIWESDVGEGFRPTTQSFDVGVGASQGIQIFGGQQTHEFNVQGGAGVRWFVKNDLSMSLEGRYLHLSCAGISRPNLGANTVFGMVGVTCFF